MFDVSFSELLLIGVIALIVIGPERLPKVARTIGHLVGRAQRYVSDVKTDIQREMDLGELTNLKEQMDDAAKSVKTSLETASQDLRKPMEEAKDAFKDASDSVNDLIAATKASEAEKDAGSQAAIETTRAADHIAPGTAIDATAPDTTLADAAATPDDATLPLPGFAEPEVSQAEIWPPLGTPMDAPQALDAPQVAAPPAKPMTQAPVKTVEPVAPSITPASPARADTGQATPTPATPVSHENAATAAPAADDAPAPGASTPPPTGTPK